MYRLESKYWRERKKALNLLANTCFILESKKIAVWLYVELEKRLKMLEKKYKNNPEVLEIIQGEYEEIDLFRKYNKWYGSVFYIMQK